jgi:cytosine/adenosine deaminase-related metal-dependent hydrolase
MLCEAGVCTDVSCAPTACDDGNICTTGETTAPDCTCGGGIPLTGTTCGTNMVCQAGVCTNAPPAGPVLTHLGRPDRLLLSGTVIAPDTFFDGQVLIEGTTITCVAPGTACAAMPDAADATVIDTAGIISPGLVDTHNHVLFDLFDENDWTPSMIYQNHNQWPAEPRYQAMLDVKQCLANDSQGKPTWCANTSYGTSTGNLRCEMDKYGELKQLVGGTTSVVGLTGTSAACFGSLARSIDTPQNGLGTDKIQTSSLFPPSKSSADGVCANFSTGKTNAYLIHCGEGVDAASLAEFGTLGTVTTTDYCLYAPQTTITHGIAFTANEFGQMARAGMKLTWSPASNVFLHGNTADIPTALAAGVTVALAPDWSIGGSQNMLDELRFADAWDNSHWNDRLAPKDLVDMATINGAKVLAVDDRLGQIKTGYLADLAVFAGDRSHPYDAILAAAPNNVTLVTVGGTVLYGDAVLQAAGPAQPGCETLDICGAQKFLCVATSNTTNKLNQTFAQISDKLSQAMLDVDAQTPLDGYNFAPIAPLVKCH